MIEFELLVKHGVHFGHEKSRWSPKMAPYIWGYKNNIHLIDVSKTAFQLEKSAQFLKDLAANNKQILWIGTKKAAQTIMKEAAEKLNMPHVTHRWIGGTLSNFSQVKKSITKLLHYEDILAKAEKYPHFTKKELNVINKVAERLRKNIGGILQLKWPVDAVVIVDVRKERSALKEASIMGIPVVALVDTNCDPSQVDYVIPANDDAPRSIKVIIDYLTEAVQAGQKLADKKKEEKKAEAELRATSDKDKKQASAVAKAMADKEKAAPKKVETKKAEEKTSKKEVAPKVSATTKASVFVKAKLAPTKTEAPKKVKTIKAATTIKTIEKKK